MAAPTTFLAWADISPLDTPPPAQGEMGVVIPATHRGHRVAVKVFKAALRVAGEQEAVALLQAEVGKMAAASECGLNDFVVVPVGLVVGAASAPVLAALGPHASACIATGSAPPSHLCGMVMKWEDGGTLHDLLHSAMRVWGVGTAERLLMCAQLATGVAALHAAGVIHGDVKGGNVMLSDRSATPRPRFTDFGFSQLRCAASAASAASSRGVGKQCGTWPYMAPEMLLEKDGSPPEGVSRSGDVYALATLCWEVLSGKIPWEGISEQSRVNMLMHGTPGGPATLLKTPNLPLDTPAAVRALLGCCFSDERGTRPCASRVAEVLHQAAQDMSSGSYDIFLSHAWDDGKHAPLTTEVYLRLLDAGYRVWLDTTDMGADPQASMLQGVERSRCVVALMSARYETRPACLFELQCAKDKEKPVVACLADAAEGWFPAEGSELLRLVPKERHLFPDLRNAAAVSWREDMSAKEREKLTKAPEALPKVLQLVRQVLAPSKLPQPHAAQQVHMGGGSGGGSGADGTGRPVQLPTTDMTPSQVVGLMRARIQDPLVAEAGAYALQVLATPAGGEKPCVDAGAVPVLVAALQAHLSVPAVAVNACAAMQSIACIRAGQEACVIAGAIPWIVTALKAHPSNPDVTDVCCRALQNLTTENPAGQEASVAAGAAPALVAALSAHIGVPTVVVSACAALTCTVQIPAGREACVATDAVPALVAALKAHCTVPSVAEEACRTLFHIGDNSPHYKASIIAAGAVAAAAEAFNAFHVSVSVVRRSARAEAHNLLSSLGWAATKPFKC